MLVPIGDVRGRVVLGDNLAVLCDLPNDSVDLIYVDPPFNTGKRQMLHQMKTVQDANGDRTGFSGKRYRTITLGKKAYGDVFDDYLEFLEPRMIEFHRVLKRTGSLYFHIDYREVHYCKVLLDSIFGRDCFLNEVIWAYDYGARTTKRWPAKHDNILMYVKSATDYYFNTEEVERIPYMAPGLVGPEKTARGKLPTDTWWHTIVPPGSKERTGYPNQKPIGILRRMICASCPPEGLVADFFAGSGSAGEASYRLDRRFLMVDSNREAVDVMAKRYSPFQGIEYVGIQKPQDDTSQQLSLGYGS